MQHHQPCGCHEAQPYQMMPYFDQTQNESMFESPEQVSPAMETLPIEEKLPDWLLDSSSSPSSSNQSFVAGASELGEMYTHHDHHADHIKHVNHGRLDDECAEKEAELANYYYQQHESLGAYPSEQYPGHYGIMPQMMPQMPQKPCGCNQSNHYQHQYPQHPYYNPWSY